MLIFFLLIFVPITPVFVLANETKEIDFIIYYREGSDPFINELISKAESLGLTVNPIYLTWGQWYYETHFTDWWDLTYGGILEAYAIDDIATLGYTVMGTNYYILRHDDIKLDNLAWDLWNMRSELLTNPDVDIEDLSEDMLDKFHDAEERMWENQYMFTFIQWVSGQAVRSEVAIPNCQAGHAFADENLRLTFSSLIDRTLFLDYYQQFFPSLPVYIHYHMHQWSQYHDTSLPYTLPN